MPPPPPRIIKEPVIQVRADYTMYSRRITWYEWLGYLARDREILGGDYTMS